MNRLFNVAKIVRDVDDKMINIVDQVYCGIYLSQINKKLHTHIFNKDSIRVPLG